MNDLCRKYCKYGVNSGTIELNAVVRCFARHWSIQPALQCTAVFCVALWKLHYTMCNAHRTLIHPTIFTMQYVATVAAVFRIAQCTMYNVHWPIQPSLECNAFIVHSVLHLYNALRSSYCALYNALYTAQCTLHNAHCKLNTAICCTTQLHCTVVTIASCSAIVHSCTHWIYITAHSAIVHWCRVAHRGIVLHLNQNDPSPLD